MSLREILLASVGQVLTPDLVLAIWNAVHGTANRIDVDAFPQVMQGDVTFRAERMETCMQEMKVLHEAHWLETEGHRHGLAFNFDYLATIEAERAGRYLLFTARQDGRLVGNCALRLHRSTHTQTMVATEDTLFLLSEARVGNLAAQFVDYCEQVLAGLGVREVRISVKKSNRAARFMKMRGYREVGVELVKLIGEDHGTQETRSAA